LLAGVSQTKSGMIIGTAAYLAPEQVARGAADARTDVYAAGVMLFELLTGGQPHTGDTPLAVAYKHGNEVLPPPSSVVPGPPPPWPGPPPDQPGHDLMPGAAPPARQSFGVPHPGSAPQSVTRQFQPEPYRPGGQHTLIVSGADGSPYGPPQLPGYAPPEPRL